MSEAYDRQEGESSKAFAAFCSYRDLGPSRSVDAAYCLHTGAEPGTKQASGNFKRYATTHNWVERAAKFDADADAQNRKMLLERNKAEYNERVEKYRKQTESLGLGFMNLASQLTVCFSKLADPIMQKLAKGGDVTKDELDLLKDIPNALRAIATSSEIGSRLAGDAYHLSTMLADIQSREQEGVSDVSG
jgi:hypothetical protein